MSGTTISLQTPSPTFATDSPFTVAGQKLTPNSSAFLVLSSRDLAP